MKKVHVGSLGAPIALTESNGADDASPNEPSIVEPNAPANVRDFENPTPDAPTLDRLAPHYVVDVRARLQRTVLWLARLGGPALTAAATLWVSGCATTAPTQTVHRGRPSLPRPPAEQMSQLDHPKTWLGSGQRRTIAEAGCFLTSLAMASEALTELDWDPVKANDAVKAGGGFSGPALDLDDACRALGIRVNWRGKLTSASLAKRHAALDQHLASKRVAVASVDIGPGASSGESEGDHFILIYAKRGDAYYAVDPLGGRLVELTPNDDGFLQYGNDQWRVCELCLLSAR